jgi:cyclic pyranopterin phosphate synthase
MLTDNFTSARPAMVDGFGRSIKYLRVSVTDRCDLRCVYCMAEDMTFLPKRDLLTIEELDRLCSGVEGREETPLNGWRAIGPTRHHDLVSLARAPSRRRDT